MFRMMLDSKLICKLPITCSSNFISYNENNHCSKHIDNYRNKIEWNAHTELCT